MSVRFLVAKYVPDTKRMEPRNIGVVVWNNGRAQAKFLGESTPLPRSIGIRDKDTYGKWIAAWKSQLAKPSLEFGCGQIASKSTPAFLDALREWSRGNFLLVDGGEVTEKVTENDTDQLTQYLFRQLVGQEDTKDEKESESIRLKEQVGRILKASGVSGRNDLREDEPTWYRVFGVLRNFQSNYVLGPLGKPYSIFNRIPLENDKTFDSTAFHLYWFQQSRPEYPRQRIAAFILLPENPSTEQEDKCKVLDNIATVINVTDEQTAIDALKQTASLNGRA